MQTTSSKWECKYFKLLYLNNQTNNFSIPVSHLRQYIENKNFTKLFGPLNLKPWVSVEVIKNELAKCGELYNYVSTTQQYFSVRLYSCK